MAAMVSAGLASLFAAVSYVLLAAPDVAMAEAAIGSGLSTLIFLYAIRRTGGGEGVTMAELIGSILVLVGAFFLFSAGLGLLRMPDAYTRIQAGTKASTLGNMLVLAGLAFYHPGWSAQAVMIVYFVLMTNPISSHALSRAASRHPDSDGASAVSTHRATTNAPAGAAHDAARTFNHFGGRAVRRLLSPDSSLSIRNARRCRRWPRTTSSWCRRSSARRTSSPAS